MAIKFLTPQDRSIGSSHVAPTFAVQPVCANLEAYLAQFNRMQAGKHRQALELQTSVGGQFALRHEHGQRLADAGCVCDDEKQRVWKDASRSTFWTYRDLTITLVNYIKFLTEQRRRRAWRDCTCLPVDGAHAFDCASLQS